jgi:sugar lactone lactonase YvrE
VLVSAPAVRRPKRTLRRALFFVAAAIALTCAYLFFWPVPIEPEAWQPPVAPEPKGLLAPNSGLAGAERFARDLPGPEAVAIDAQGFLWTGTRDGRIVRMRLDGKDAATFAKTGGRPLGLAFAADGRLLVADANRGLLAIHKDARVEVLASGHEGKAFRFADDLAVARDGTVYFTDASTRFGLANFMEDILEHGASGRLFAFHPATRKTELLAKGLYFANGVALFPDERSILVAETSSYRIRRVWLEPGRRGQMETFADNLPGFPDNLRWSAARKVFWVSIGSPRDSKVDALAPHPFWRKVVARLPAFLRPKPQRHAHVLAFDETGRLVTSLQHIDAESYSPIASVLEHDGFLYLGSFLRNGLARARAPAIP